jgi:hypothetical protein
MSRLFLQFIVDFHFPYFFHINSEVQHLLRFLCDVSIFLGEQVSPCNTSKNLKVSLPKNSNTNKQERKRYKMHKKEQIYLVDKKNQSFLIRIKLCWVH